MPYCQQFKNQIAQWEKELSEARVLLGEYLESGEEEKVREVREKIKEISDSQEEFLEGEFEAQVKRMFNKWCPHGIQFILDYLDVGKEGRVTLSRHLDLRGTGASYCPLLLKQIQDNLNVSGTKITSIDELEVIKGDFACIIKVK